uniref:Protein sleepless n=1 Tax=Strongyloides papillosus TaxID=174720 RepID=A0A0N5BQD4_STREA
MFSIFKLCLILIWSHLLTFVTSENTGVWCYDCNSLNDKACLNEYQKFENECPVHNINESVSLTPTGCRKIIQHINDDTSVIRECAYSGKLMTNYKNMGSHGIKRYITQCNENFCNSSNNIIISHLLLSLGMLLLLLQIFN